MWLIQLKLLCKTMGMVMAAQLGHISLYACRGTWRLLAELTVQCSWKAGTKSRMAGLYYIIGISQFFMNKYRDISIFSVVIIFAMPQLIIT